MAIEKVIEMFKIRPYKAEDQAEVLNLHHVALEVIGAFKGDGHWDSDLNQIEKVYNGKDSIFLVGEENGKILAMGAFKKTGETVAELKRMRVLPELQNKGYGRKIYYELERIAKTMGYTKLHLETSVLQIPAQKLYEKIGFRKCGQAIIDGYDCILYEKELLP